MKKFFYRVVEGDSAISVCQKFNCSVGSLIYNNNLKKEISAGDILLIEKCDNLYLVKPTDTLSSLAKKFNLLGQEILEKNHLPYLFSGLFIEL